MRLIDITPQPARVLLINVHAIDIRLPWGKWHQPTGLLQIGSALIQQDCDVRLIDCLTWDSNSLIRRKKVKTIEIDGQSMDLWRFGVSWGHLNDHLHALKKDGWIPDQVFVSCGQTTWWQAAQEIIHRVKTDWFPGVPVVLGGVYPSLEPDHAQFHTQADLVVAGSVPEARDQIPDFQLYANNHIPNFAGIYLYRSQCVTDVENEMAVVPRPPDEIAREVEQKAQLGVTTFAFFDEEVRFEHRQHLIDVLEAIASLGRKRIGLVSVGNISPRLIDTEVAHYMGKANYRQVYLKCDVTHYPQGASFDTSYDTYRTCVDALHKETKFKPRTDQINALLLVGIPYESLEEVAERLIRLASIVGSVNLVQYQHSSRTKVGDLYLPLIGRQNGNLKLENLNCKLYPLARLVGIPLDHYLELTRLAALLNSKFRSKTFDFLGDSIIERAVQNSFLTEGWNPFISSPSSGLSEIIPLDNASGKRD